MNFTKAQKEVFNALCGGVRTLAKFMIDENHVLVTPDGYRAFIFPVSTVAFSLERIRDLTPFPVPVKEIVKPENKLTLTNDLRLTDEFPKRTLRRLKADGKSVFVNIKFLDCFQNPNFYQAEHNLSIVVVTEKIPVGGHGTSHFTETPVGIILPVRADWACGHYNDD